MHAGQNRNISILGGLWLVLGGHAIVRAVVAFAQHLIEPSAAADWADFSGYMLVLGFIHMVNGWALLRRNQMARPLLAISSFVLIVLYALSFGPPPEYSGAGDNGFVLSIPVVGVVMTASLWLALSGRGKKALKS
jgi:hypothetical protein